MLVLASFSFSFRRCRNRAEAPALRARFSSATFDAACTSTGMNTGPCSVEMGIIRILELCPPLGEPLKKILSDRGFMYGPSVPGGAVCDGLPSRKGALKVEPGKYEEEGGS